MLVRILSKHFGVRKLVRALLGRKVRLLYLIEQLLNIFFCIVLNLQHTATTFFSLEVKFYATIFLAYMIDDT